MYFLYFEDILHICMYSVALYMYIYIYMCVCVCVCVQLRQINLTCLYMCVVRFTPF